MLHGGSIGIEFDNVRGYEGVTVGEGHASQVKSAINKETGKT